MPDKKTFLMTGKSVGDLKQGSIVEIELDKNGDIPRHLIGKLQEVPAQKEVTPVDEQVKELETQLGIKSKELETASKKIVDLEKQLSDALKAAKK